MESSLSCASIVCTIGRSCGRHRVPGPGSRVFETLFRVPGFEFRVLNDVAFGTQNSEPRRRSWNSEPALRNCFVCLRPRSRSDAQSSQVRTMKQRVSAAWPIESGPVRPSQPSSCSSTGSESHQVPVGRPQSKLIKPPTRKKKAIYESHWLAIQRSALLVQQAELARQLGRARNSLLSVLNLEGVFSTLSISFASRLTPISEGGVFLHSQVIGFQQNRTRYRGPGLCGTALAGRTDSAQGEPSQAERVSNESIVHESNERGPFQNSWPIHRKHRVAAHGTPVRRRARTSR